MKRAVLAACWAGALLCSGTLMAAAEKAAQVFAFSVMPALFPVLVLGALQAAGKPSRHACAGTLLLGLCSGSPGGARQVAAQARRGRITARQLRFLLGATGTMSPLFFTGALSAWLGGGGALMLGCHWAGALAVGAAYAYRGGRRGREGLGISSRAAGGGAAHRADGEGRANGERAMCAGATVDGTAAGAESGTERRDAPLDLRALLGGAMDALLLVLGAMMLGACACALLETALRWLWPGLPEGVAAALHAALEIGGGAERMAGALGARGTALVCGLCSLGGASLLMQNLSMLDGLASWRTLLALRLAHGGISYGLCRAMLALWPQLAGMQGTMGVHIIGKLPNAAAESGGAAWVAAALLAALVLAKIGLSGAAAEKKRRAQGCGEI